MAWVSSASSNTPVYHMYNLWSGDHFYTSDKDEYNSLEKIGWREEGTAFYSVDDSVGISSKRPIYRLFNPWLTQSTYLYTAYEDEYNHLGQLGWYQEDIEFLCLERVAIRLRAGKLEERSNIEGDAAPFCVVWLSLACRHRK